MIWKNMLKEKVKDSTVMLPLSEIMPNPMQPRRRFDESELTALCESIKQFGVIQPIAVKKLEPLPFPMPQPKAKYEIIAGERRWRASKMAGLTHIPCIIHEADRQESAMMALIENLQRSDLSYFEEALAMQNLMLLSGKSQTELASTLSISQSTLSNKLRLLRLSERERLMAIENGFSERHVRALVRIDSERERRPIMLEIIKNRLSAPDTERLVETRLKNGKTARSTRKSKKNTKTLKGSIRDIRFLYNTVEKAVRLLAASGMNASWSKEENGDRLTVMISVSDPNSARSADVTATNSADNAN